jgi:hypothetical protein
MVFGLGCRQNAPADSDEPFPSDAEVVTQRKNPDQIVFRLRDNEEAQYKRKAFF